MNLQVTTYRFVRYIFTLVIFVGLACSSDDNTIEDEDVIIGDSGVTMKINGELWNSDIAIVQTWGGQEMEEDYIMIVINAMKYIGDSDDEENMEGLVINIYLNVSDFTNPKGKYLVPPPPNDLEVPGYAAGSYTSMTNAINYYSFDPDNEQRKVGEVNITDFKISENEHLNPLIKYASLKGTFEFEMMGVNRNTGEYSGMINVTEGKFNILPSTMF